MAASAAALVQGGVGAGLCGRAGCCRDLAGVVAMVRAWVSRAVRLDWLRVGASLPGAAVLPSWCVIAGRYGSLRTQEQFRTAGVLVTSWHTLTLLLQTALPPAGGAH